ncbi:sensor histidine kinase [Alkalicoccobacillus porphyridii]|uniref:histidine kinase n=1 Tax=Alkalicoccobacillus porphyridii TaxID=2597270 RepID=A0A554A0Q6_9BACI|nr:HAMP domain-containing sensor histidine kinase [Alkalicoccobacillus porphyridii]TSB47279.1 HAMP domain-containing histidine kinase [Alkalicoccobacillus porphyridii]
MLRNKEVKRFLFSSLAVTGLGAGLALIESVLASIIVFIVALLLIGIFLIFTKRRYQQMEHLAEYLRGIAAGQYLLDVRDNEEGELSILKNDIYRVTRMLSEQSAEITQEKGKLTDAISDISHQLKTPLTSMTVMADLLSDNRLEEEKRKEFTRHILIQLERMDWLVSSLLKLSKIDAGTITFKREPVKVEQLLEQALQPSQIPMELKNVQVSVKGDKTIQFLGDQYWSTEAFVNLVKNAVEHTPENGTIQLNYSENVLYTEIQIEDNGSGIPKEDLPHIFKRFYKGKHAKDGSVGIGLALVHQIIKSQNGDIEVESKEGDGTTFSIKFFKSGGK